MTAFGDDMEDQLTTWEKLPEPVATTLQVVLDNRDMPPSALGCYARWWQLENWLRTLAYVELRARDGRDWTKNLDSNAHQRRSQDEQYRYMASPDWEDPLAYLDARKLFQVIQENWEHFEKTLPERETWRGRTSELLSIRNRIGHLRRPHRDDLSKLKQTLRDLEHGAFLGITSYNANAEIGSLSDVDPVTSAFKEDTLPDAEELRSHASTNYGIETHLFYTLRPWSRHEFGEAGTGTQGLLWKASFHSRGKFDVRKFWENLNRSTREVLMHVLLNDKWSIEVTIPAVEGSSRVLAALGDLLKRAMRSLDFEAYPSPEITRLPPMDSRVQLNTALSFVDSSMTPITLFGA